jgi:ribosomal protein L27
LTPATNPTTRNNHIPVILRAGESCLHERQRPATTTATSSSARGIRAQYHTIYATANGTVSFRQARKLRFDGSTTTRKVVDVK